MLTRIVLWWSAFTSLPGGVSGYVAFGYLVDAFGGRYDVPLMLFSGMLAVSAIVFTTIDPTRPLVETAVASSEPVVPA